MDNVYKDVLSGVYRLLLISPLPCRPLLFHFVDHFRRITGQHLFASQDGGKDLEERTRGRTSRDIGCMGHPTARTATTGHDAPTPPVCLCGLRLSQQRLRSRTPSPPFRSGEGGNPRLAAQQIPRQSQFHTSRLKGHGELLLPLPLTSDRTVAVNQQQEHL